MGYYDKYTKIISLDNFIKFATNQELLVKFTREVSKLGKHRYEDISEHRQEKIFKRMPTDLFAVLFSIGNHCERVKAKERQKKDIDGLHDFDE